MNNQIYTYSEKENKIWMDTFDEQIKLLETRGYHRCCELLEKANLARDRVPQMFELSKSLSDKTGWKIVPVNTGLTFTEYMSYLNKKLFPSTTYMRTEKGFAPDPDIFHEFFGHIPMLLDKDYSDFILKLASVSMRCSDMEKILIQRIFWFTIEVGLIETHDGLRAYGASLLSSPQELVYSLNDESISEKKTFDLLDIYRTPYRSDEIQKTYFIINSLDDLYSIDLSSHNLEMLTRDAKGLGEYPAKFVIENNKYTSVNCL